MGLGERMDKSEMTSTVGFERGGICEKKTDGGGSLYKVKSSTRDGIVSRWMEAVNAYMHENTPEGGSENKYEYNTGDLVYYFMFPDGRGMILGKVRKDI